jgi:hypothetical protein
VEGQKKVMVVKSSQCGVVWVADFREQVNEREQRFEVKMNKIRAK